MNKNTPMRYVCELVLLKVYNWREITCMEVTFTVSKWDENQLMTLEKIFLLILLMLNMILMGN